MLFIIKKKKDLILDTNQSVLFISVGNGRNFINNFNLYVCDTRNSKCNQILNGFSLYHLIHIQCKF